jgi:hypothetical protein
MIDFTLYRLRPLDCSLILLLLHVLYDLIVTLNSNISLLFSRALLKANN